MFLFCFSFLFTHNMFKLTTQSYQLCCVFVLFFFTCLNCVAVYILCCVFVLFFFFLFTLCCQFIILLFLFCFSSSCLHCVVRRKTKQKHRRRKTKQKHHNMINCLVYNMINWQLCVVKQVKKNKTKTQHNMINCCNIVVNKKFFTTQYDKLATQCKQVFILCCVFVLFFLEKQNKNTTQYDKLFNTVL